MAPRSAPKRATKPETSEVSVQTMVPPEPAPVPVQKEEASPAPAVDTSAEILKAVAKLQRSVNKTQRAVQAIQAGGDPASRLQKVKREPSGFARPSRISPELSSFLGVPPDTRLARTQVTKLLTEYIKKHELQCGDNKLDDKLKQLLNVPEGTIVTFFNLQKHCKNHYIADEPDNVSNGSHTSQGAEEVASE
jgi:chromatin remodeling complex protein RSC6